MDFGAGQGEGRGGGRGNWSDDERKKFFLSAVSRSQDFLGMRNSRGSNIPLK